MKLALISDIHGNLPALEAVQEELARENIDQMLCLGDVALFGPQPRAALRAVQALGCPVVMGNTDAWALDPQPTDRDDERSRRITAIELWGAAQFGEAERSFIQSFAPRISLMLEGVSLLGYHGSPNSFHDLIVATTPDEEVAELCAGFDATLMAGGHSHAQMVRRWGASFLINPGSIGMPYETVRESDTSVNPAWAEYAVITVVDDIPRIELRRAAYDLNQLRRVVEHSDMPYAEWWLADWR